MVPPHYAPANDAQRPDLRTALGLSIALLPEPEVLKADIGHIRCKTLADMIAHLINETEPMLRAKAEGATVTVRDCDGAMRLTVETAK
jgi:hypothetical protein